MILNAVTPVAYSPTLPHRYFAQPYVKAASTFKLENLSSGILRGVCCK